MQTTFARTIPAIPQLFGVSQWFAKFFIPESQRANADESRVDNIRALQRMAPVSYTHLTLPTKA